MKKGFHLAVAVDVSAQCGVARLEQSPVFFRGYKGGGIHAQIVAETQNVRHVAHCGANFLQRGHMPFHQLVQQPLYLIFIGVDVHQEVIHPPEEGSPFK